MLVPDGFPGQRYRILSRPVAIEAARQPLTSALLVTDSGYFPYASGHGRSRPTGVEQVIAFVCVDGVGSVSIAGRTHTVAAGDAVIIERGVGHVYRADPGRPWSVWWMHVVGREVDQLAKTIVSAAGGPVVRVRNVYPLVSLFETVVSAMERDETRASLYVATGAGWHVLSKLAADATAETGANADRMELAQEYLRQHLDTRLTVTELARLADMSTSHFSALFRGATGVSVTEYLKRLRSARARELLVSTDAPVSEIARAVGYDDAFYFSRQFRAVNGMSPTAFREAARLHTI